MKVPKDLDSVGDRLEWARNKMGFTQAQICAGVGISQPVLSQLKHGKNKESKHLPAIARFIGVDTDWLASGVGDPLGPSAKARHLAAIFDHLDEADQLLIEALINRAGDRQKSDT